MACDCESTAISAWFRFWTTPDIVTVYVVQDQTEVRERLAAELVELLGPDVFPFPTPWDLEASLEGRRPQPDDIIVTDLVSPDYWQQSPKSPARQRSRPHSTDPENTKLALVDAAIDRIENYLKPIFDRYGLRFVVYSRLADLVDGQEAEAVLLIEALSAIGVAPDDVIDRSRVYGEGPDDLIEVVREVARLVDPSGAARLGPLYVVEDHSPTASRIAKALAGLEKTFSIIRVVPEIWYVPGTGSPLAGKDDEVPSVVVSDLFPITYWDPKENPKPPLSHKRFKRSDRLSFEAIMAAAEDVAANYFKELTDSGAHGIVYTHVLPYARDRSKDEEANVMSWLTSAGIAPDDIIEKALRKESLDNELQSIRDRVDSAIEDLARHQGDG